MLVQPYGQVRAIEKLENFYKDAAVFGFDTETPNFKPRLLQISDGQREWIFQINGNTILDEFIDFFREVPAKYIVVFAHNLSFDMSVLMYLDTQTEKQLLIPECKWKYRDVTIEYFQGPPHFASIYYGKKKTVEIRDTFSYFGRIKLDTLAKAMGFEGKKEIDKEEFKSDIITVKMLQYAGHDAKLTALIGGRIMDFHASKDVSLSVSGPSMAMKIFRKEYLQDALIPPPEKWMRYFELSYHGGKNGCYVLTPREIKNVYLYDINSAYPNSMCSIVNFAGCTYHEHRRYKPDVEGIWCISGISQCKYNSTFYHDFSPIKKLRNNWITSYELKSLIQHGCIDDLEIHFGIEVREKKDYNPLREYAQYWYKMKSNEPKTSPMYLFYKVVMLNALYGKFIERRVDPYTGHHIRGSAYNPALASLITGHTRAYLHDLEHESNAIHSASDSVFTLRKLEEKKGLGGLSCEGYGNLQLFRTKCYIFRDGDGKLLKYAQHGFHGNFSQLEELWNSRGHDYTYEKIPTIREIYMKKNLNLKAYGMNAFKAKLNINWEYLNQGELF